MHEGGDAGFRYRTEMVIESAFGGEEVVVILEKDKDAAAKRFE